jgi:hypothetical protein
MSIVYCMRHAELKPNDILTILNSLDESSKVTCLPAARPQSGTVIVFKPGR